MANITTLQPGASAQLKNKLSALFLTWTDLGAKWQPQQPGTPPQGQRWYLLGLDNDQYFLMEHHSKKILTLRSDRGDVPTGDYNAGIRALALTDPYRGADAATAKRQRFFVRPVGNGAYTITSVDGGLLVTLADGGLVRLMPSAVNAQRSSPGAEQWNLDKGTNSYSAFDTTRLGPTNSAVTPPPDMTDYARPHPDTTSEVLLGVTTLPFPLVNDPSYPVSAQQAGKSPWYFVRRYGFYRVGYYYDSSGVAARTETQSVRVGLTSTNSQEVEQTTGLSVTSEAGFAFKGLSASVSTTYSQQLRTLTSQSTSQSSEKSLTVERRFDQGYRNAIAIWYRTDRYALQRVDGSTVLTWETTLENDTVERSYAPNRPR